MPERLVGEGVNVDVFQKGLDLLERVCDLGAVDAGFFAVADGFGQFYYALGGQLLEVSLCQLGKERNVGLSGQVGEVELVDPLLKHLFVMLNLGPEGVLDSGVSCPNVSLDLVHQVLMLFAAVNQRG